MDGRQSDNFVLSDPATWPVTLSREEVLLISNVSEPTLRRMVRKGAFPAPIRMPGVRKLLWSKRDVLLWLGWPDPAGDGEIPY